MRREQNRVVIQSVATGRIQAAATTLLVEVQEDAVKR